MSDSEEQAGKVRRTLKVMVGSPHSQPQVFPRHAKPAQ
jgi:hypothetical protein